MSDLTPVLMSVDGRAVHAFNQFLNGRTTGSIAATPTTHMQIDHLHDLEREIEVELA